MPTLLVGGAERHTVELCERLRQRGYPAAIMVHQTAVSPAFAAMSSAGEATVLGVSGMSSAGGWLTVWKALRWQRPDIVVAVNQTPFIVAAVVRLSGGTRAKLACVFHTTELQAYEKHQERLFLPLSRFADLMIYVGEKQKASWQKRGARARRSIVVHNGIDIARFAAAQSKRTAVRQRFGIADDAYLLGILASFRVEKNHVELIAALACVRAAGTRAMLLCIGAGPTRPNVEDYAQRLGVEDALIFAGEQADVAPLIAACDVGVICSKIETFPLSALEFLATGVPVLASAVGGVTEIVRANSNGLLYQGGDIAALAAGIIALAEPERRASLARRAAASVADLSVESMVDRYAGEFDALARS